MIRNLEYRAPRACARFDIDFVTTTGQVRGTCVDVSEKGMRAEFGQNLPMGQVGTVIFHHPLGRGRIPARVVYLVKDQVGLAFFPHSIQEREALSHLMTAFDL